MSVGRFASVRRRWGALLLWAAFSASSGAALAQAQPDANVDPRAGGHPRGGLLSTWNTTKERWFVSARADLGFLFFRPRVSAGFGIPHQSWWGVDVVPILSSVQGGGYAGVRYRHPRVEIRTGALFSKAFYRGALPVQRHYDERDLELRLGAPASYVASDSELTLSAPLGRTFLQSETQLIYLPFDTGEYLFVDTLGVVVAPPWAAREQVRWSLPLPAVPGLFFGPAVEAVWVPERDASWVLRAGGTVRFRMYQDFQLRTDILPTVLSPDTFGRSGSAWLMISARLLWGSNHSRSQ